MSLHRTTLGFLEDCIAYAIEDLNTDLSKDELIEAYEDDEKIEEAKEALRNALEDL